MGSVLSLLSLSHLPKVYLSQTHVYLRVKKSGGSQVGPEKISLQELVQQNCRSLFANFRPAWWLFNGHLQTGYSVIGDFSKSDKVVYDRTLLELKDGGTLGLDFTPPAAERVCPDDTPIIVVLHGLTGGSHESYVRAILAPAITPVEEGGLGYRGAVLNFRGCAGVPLTTPFLYSCGATDDVRQGLMYISTLYPNAPLLGIGFSLGANVLTKYVAEEGVECRMVSAVALGCPWDMELNGHTLNDHWLNRNVYSKALASNLKNLIARHIEDLAKFPESRLTKSVPAVMLSKSLTLTQFDNLVTRHSGGAKPPFPFPDAYDYYRWGSTHHALPDIQIPFLGMNSEDDPIVRHVPVDANNKWVTIVLTQGGGHLGWFEAPEGVGGPIKRWVTKPVLEWFKATAEGVIVDHRVPRELSTVDGWVVEAGHDDLGCRVIEKGEMVVGVEGEGGLLAGL